MLRVCWSGGHHGEDSDRGECDCEEYQRAICTHRVKVSLVACESSLPIVNDLFALGEIRHKAKPISGIIQDIFDGQVRFGDVETSVAPRPGPFLE